MEVKKESPLRRFVSSQGTPRLQRIAQRVGRDFTATAFSMPRTGRFEAGIPNHDALGWQFDRYENGEVLSFAMCRGIEASELGYIAARYLATRLVGGLLHWASFDDGLERLTPDFLAEELDRWTADGQTEVTQERAQGAQESEEASEKGGSEAVFFAGCLDCRPGGKSAFIWIGEVGGQVFDAAGQGRLDTAERRDTRSRWSTDGGVKGKVQLRLMETRHIRRILALTKGIAYLEEDLVAAHNYEEETAVIDRAQTNDLEDDASFLVIRIKPVQAGFLTATPLETGEGGPTTWTRPKRVTGNGRFLQRPIVMIALALVAILLIGLGLVNALAGGGGTPASVASTGSATPPPVATQALAATSLPVISASPTIAAGAAANPSPTSAAPAATATIVAATPTQIPAPTSPLPAGWATYRVKANETLIDVAKQFQVGVGPLVVANNLNHPFDVKEGDTVKVPSKDYRPPQVNHRVRKNESFFAISYFYDVNPETIWTTNKLQRTSLIFPDQILIVPLTYGP